MKNGDVTKTLISEHTIQKDLTSIFTEAIIVNDNFSIVGVSKNTLQLLGFESGEVTGKSLTYLSTSDSLLPDLQKELSEGFFDNSITAALKTKSFGFVTCQISGFYLGLISDMSGYIVLRIKPIDEIRQLNLQLEKSREELDEFIYRAAHDLRGPLATIRGLINLIKHHPTPDELNDLVKMLDKHTETMDERLSGLHYLSASGRADTPAKDLNCYALESALRKTLEENIPINAVDFQFSTAIPIYKDIHEQLTTSVLNNILLYLLSLPQSHCKSLTYKLVEFNSGLRVEINSKGFFAGYSLMQALQQKALLYSNAATYSQLINYYAAQKIARKMKATIQILFVDEGEQNISIIVPQTRNIHS